MHGGEHSEVSHFLHIFASYSLLLPNEVGNYAECGKCILSLSICVLCMSVNNRHLM